ncbi:MAG: decarboxylating NADP(+)-dependent phosphogluconate dehydrogenase [Lentisphaeria bacterium]|nr:decarboxylating NADP(+)-dependent phosphogluconate dehydrogenase [Lentisphaeria bacterium]
MDHKADIGLIGLAVMGENLVLNLERNGFSVAIFNRHTNKVDSFIRGRGNGKKIIPCYSSAELCAALTSPRRILLMVKAGDPVDELIAALLPHLDPGDILIDGGNSFFKDTIRRYHQLAEKGIFFVGAGISGGEKGALYGPSIMPGGDSRAWQIIKPLLQKIAAKTENDIPCCEWIGSDGAGHYVKMVHNGIEYGDMQMICDAYGIMKNLLGLSANEIAVVFEQWNQGNLNSYLIGITAAILRKKDPQTGQPLVDMILDRAGQKGTGKWTVESALELGIATPSFTDAVFMRFISVLNSERNTFSHLIPRPIPEFSGERKEFIESLRQALYASKICSYAQGFHLMYAAAKEYGWTLDFASIARIWQNGCIIRAVFLEKIAAAFEKEQSLSHLFMDEFFASELIQCQAAWRSVISQAVSGGIPVPAFSGALSYFDCLCSEKLTINLLQAQRDFFGAHCYERIDQHAGEFFHTEWETEDQ